MDIFRRPRSTTIVSALTSLDAMMKIVREVTSVLNESQYTKPKDVKD